MVGAFTVNTTFGNNSEVLATWCSDRNAVYFMLADLDLSDILSLQMPERNTQAVVPCMVTNLQQSNWEALAQIAQLTLAVSIFFVTWLAP